MSENILRARLYPSVSPINDTEIVIMGGISTENWLGDIIIFNTTTKNCKKEALVEIVKFQAPTNQCANISWNKVYALICNKDDKPAMISWTKGELTIKILAQRIGE